MEPGQIPREDQRRITASTSLEHHSGSLTPVRTVTARTLLALRSRCPCHPSRKECHASTHPNGGHARGGRLDGQQAVLNDGRTTFYYYGYATPYVGDRANDDTTYFKAFDAL